MPPVEEQKKRDLPANKDIVRLARHADYMYQRWQEAEVYLQERIEMFQRDCSHNNFELVNDDESKPLGKKCKKCCIVVPYPWRVCTECGGKMEQRGVVMTNIFFTCLSCGKGYAHSQKE